MANVKANTMGAIFAVCQSAAITKAGARPANRKAVAASAICCIRNSSHHALGRGAVADLLTGTPIPRHQDRDAFQTDCDVTLFGKHLEVASWSAAKIEYRERRLTLDMPQQRLNVLADVVIARAFPEFFGTLIVVLQREAGDFLQVLRMQLHVRPTRANGVPSACSWPLLV